MVAHIRLDRSGIETSRLGFGTSRLHYLRSQDRQRLLLGAFDLGVTHVDTAPAYGDGAAETAVGCALRGRRGRVVVVTKYGVPPDPVARAVPMIAPLWRIGRGVMGRIGLRRTRLPSLTASGLMKSVESSLRRLGTEYIDILLLHEPTVARIVDATGLYERLEKLKARGVVRAFGLAGAWPQIEAILKMSGPTSTRTSGQTSNAFGCVVQTAESAWDTASPPDITFGAISKGRQSYFQRPVDRAFAEQQLTDALRRRSSGVVLVSSTKLENLKTLTRAAEKVCT